MHPKKLALIAYHIVFATIALANFSPQFALAGWDGIYAELNPLLNIVRGLSAGWQEYYGAGTVGGHGFAATLPHSILISFLNTIVPDVAIRSVFALLCYYVGGLGVMITIPTLLRRLFHQPHELPKETYAVGFVAALYYLVNLGTIQTFYVPLEAFTVHFAAFPWIIYWAFELLEQQSKRNIAAFTLVVFLSSVQGFIPSIFIAIAMSLVAISGVYVLTHASKRTAFTSLALLWTCFLVANLYWLGPLGYFSQTKSHEYINAYNNITSTLEFIGKSIQFGDIADVALLRGLYWDSVELGGPIMAPWINHHTSAITSIGYAWFVLALYGIVFSLIYGKKHIAWGLVISFLYFFGNLAIDTPPFQTAIEFIQKISPNLTLAFRTTFTKFSIGMAYFYALFAGIGIYGIIHIAGRRDHALRYLLPLTAGITLILYGFPIWQGNLVYRKLYTQIPNQYSQLISYINTLPLGRVADLPQDCAEGWYNQLWGYFGSGFMWYGVKHPVMARAFDVWSPNNENYYWELTRNLRQENYEAVAKVFDKYDVRYVVYDPNITHCKSQKGFSASNSFATFVAGNTGYMKLAEFPIKNYLPLEVYARTRTESDTFVQQADTLPNVTPIYDFSDRDMVFTSYGPYMTNDDSVYDITRTQEQLFSGRGTAISQNTLSQMSRTHVGTVQASSITVSQCPGNTNNSGFTHSQSTNLYLRLVATETKQCLTISFDGLDTSFAYTLDTASKFISGNPLRISVTNKGRPVGLDVRLPKETNNTTHSYFIPPTFPSETNYTVTIENASSNRYSSINDISSISLYKVETVSDPLYRVESEITKPNLTKPSNVWHPISSLYVMQTSTSKHLMLYQSFDPGWLAFRQTPWFPYITPLGKHVQINNWANGWEIKNPSQSTVILFFWPQLLEWFGLLLLPTFIFWLTRYREK